MSQEDDLRGLAKVMDFMRALSVLFVIVNVYWFCYPSMKEWNIDIGVVDRILLNFISSGRPGCSRPSFGQSCSPSCSSRSLAWGRKA